MTLFEVQQYGISRKIRKLYNDLRRTIVKQSIERNYEYSLWLDIKEKNVIRKL